MKFQALTGLRGFCAIVVAISHLSALSWIVQSKFVQNSYLFVDFFFVLSGFVIAYAYLERLQGRVSFMAFIVRRVGRVYPLHLAVLIVMFAAEFLRFVASCLCVPMEQAPFTDGNSLPTLASNLLLAQSIGIHPFTSWNYPSWSISVEFYTYLIFAVVAVASLFLKGGMRVGLFGAVMTAAALVPIAFSQTGMFVTANYGIYRCIYGFFAGVLTFMAYRKATATRGAKVSDRRIAAACEILAAAMVVTFVLLADYGTLSFAAPIVFSVAVFIFADDAGPISALLTTRVMRYLGDRSYSIYMIHSFLAVEILHRGISVVGRYLHRSILTPHVNGLGEHSTLIDFGSPMFGDLLLVAYLGITIVIAHYTYRWIEVPWRSRFNGVADRFEARHGLADREALAEHSDIAKEASPTNDRQRPA